MENRSSQVTIIYWLVNEFFSLFRNNMRRVSLLNFLQYASGYSSSTVQQFNRVGVRKAWKNWLSIQKRRNATVFAVRVLKAGCQNIHLNI